MGKSSYIASTISISLLLFLLGIVGYFMIGAERASKELASGIKVSLFLAEDITNEERRDIEAQMKTDENIVSFTYMSSEQATTDFEQHNDIKIDTSFAVNAIPASYDITPLSLEAAKEIQNKAAEWSGVSETYYPEEVGTELSDKVNFVRRIALYLGALILFITFTLIYYTLKLSILGSAEAIRTMQMVGARNSFIKRPYIKRSVVQGFVAAFVASGLLILFIELLAETMEMPRARGEEYWKQIGMISSALCVFGVAFCTLFTTIVLGIIVKRRRK